MEAADGEEKAAGGGGGKERNNLLDFPTFTKLQNGKFKCVETGHELFENEIDSYSRSKRCRLGLIDFALATSKPPLNVFKQDPLSRSKLICKLTGDAVNKSEEHIWKHINGRRFLNKLEQEEGEQKLKKEAESSFDGVKKSKKKGKAIEEMISEVRDCSDKDSDSEEADFWMPPVGDRWDFDDGGDRWSSGSELGQDSDEENGADGAAEVDEKDSEELCVRTKRMTIEIGPSSFASRKKKSRKDPSS